MTYVREHEVAQAHPLALDAIKKADREISRQKKAMIAKAARLRARAEKMIEEAAKLDYEGRKISEYETPFSTLRQEIEDAGYWAAREVVGTFPRDANGDYLEPAPMWNVAYRGEPVGTFQAEERTDVLRMVCPPDDERSWSDFEVVRI